MSMVDSAVSSFFHSVSWWLQVPFAGRRLRRRSSEYTGRPSAVKVIVTSVMCVIVADSCSRRAALGVLQWVLLFFLEYPVRM